MLINFSVNNFKSIKNTVDFSMMAGSSKPDNNTYTDGNITLLPSSVIYGANASGKSNILEAFNTMRRIVLNQDKILLSSDTLPYFPYRLSEETEDSTTAFDIMFIENGKRYKYGFEYAKDEIYAEWLIVYETARPKVIYEYDKEVGYKPNSKIKEVRNLKRLPNSLYLWKADQELCSYANDVIRWFNNCIIISQISSDFINDDYLSFMQKEETKELITKVLEASDIGIKGIDSISFDNGKLNIKTLHQKYNSDNSLSDMAIFDFEKEESLGTQKLFHLVEPIFVSLLRGTPLFIDEFDANLHPLIIKNLIVQLCHDLDLNEKFSQLVFTTQNTKFLDQSILEKSQIWFSEKDNFGCTTLKSLLEFKGIKRTDNIENGYLLGKFGATPEIGDFTVIKQDN